MDKSDHIKSEYNLFEVGNNPIGNVSIKRLKIGDFPALK